MIKCSKTYKYCFIPRNMFDDTQSIKFESNTLIGIKRKISKNVKESTYNNAKVFSYECIGEDDKAIQYLVTIRYVDNSDGVYGYLNRRK